jgi:hypothetical protein
MGCENGMGLCEETNIHHHENIILKTGYRSGFLTVSIGWLPAPIALKTDTPFRSNLSWARVFMATCQTLHVTLPEVVKKHGNSCRKTKCTKDFSTVLFVTATVTDAPLSMGGLLDRGVV